MYSTFISTKQLHREIYEQNKPWVIIDCRFYLSDTEMGYNEYLREHVPSAIYAYLDRDLSGTVTSKTGRHPLPKIDDFNNWINSNKINNSNQIVVYDQLGGGIAARLWWMMKQLGYKQIAVLEGGIMKWKRDEFPLVSGLENRDEVETESHDLGLDWSVGPSKLYSKAEIQEIINTKVNLIDSRSHERYSGLSETIDPIAGHILSATNLFWQSHLEDDLTLKPIKLIRNNIEKIIDINEETVFYCGSGVTAAFNVLMTMHLGLPIPGLYIGSWSEWIRE